MTKGNTLFPAISEATVHAQLPRNCTFNVMSNFATEVTLRWTNSVRRSMECTQVAFSSPVAWKHIVAADNAHVLVSMETILEVFGSGQFAELTDAHWSHIGYNWICKAATSATLQNKLQYTVKVKP